MSDEINMTGVLGVKIVQEAEQSRGGIPCVEFAVTGTEDEKQALAGKNGWRTSDPTQINRWFESRVQSLNRIQDDAGSQFRRMIRLLKRFARSRGKKWNMPNGLKLTMLADECFERSAERDDKAFYILLEGLYKRLQGNLVVYNRAQAKAPQDELTRTENDESMVELRLHIWEALTTLSVIWNDKCTKESAREAWEWVFQTDGFFYAFDLRDNDQVRQLAQR
jgi:hypothetical protein